MEIRKVKFKLLASVFVAFNMLAYIYYAHADIPCPDPICIGTPQVSGNVFDDTYFNGAFDVEVDIEDYNIFSGGDRRSVYISYDAGTTWEDKPVRYSQVEFSEDMNDQVTNSTVTLLSDGKVLITWVEMDFDSPDPGTLGYILTNHRLYFRLYEPDGTPFNDAVFIDYVTPQSRSTFYGEKISLKGVRLADDQFAVVWNGGTKSGAYSGGNLYFKAFDNSGTVTVPKKMLDTNGKTQPIAGLQYEFDWYSIKPLSDDSGFVLLFEGMFDIVSGIDNDKVFARIFDNAGNKLKTVIINEDRSLFGGASLAELYGSNAGGFAVAWSDNNYGDGTALISMEMFASSGVQIGSRYTLWGASPKVIGRDDGGLEMIYLQQKRLYADIWINGSSYDHDVDTYLHHESFTSTALPILKTKIFQDPLYGSTYVNQSVHLFIPDYHNYNNVKNFLVTPNIYKTQTGGLINYHVAHNPSVMLGEDPFLGGGIDFLNYFAQTEVPSIPNTDDSIIFDGPYGDPRYGPARTFGDIVEIGAEIFIARSSSAYGSPLSYIAWPSGTVTDFPVSAVDVGKLYLLSKNKKAYFKGINSDGSIQRDIDIQIKVLNKQGWVEYLSSVRTLKYAGNDGADGSISYLNGYVNSYDSTNVTVTINNTCQSCDVLQLFQQKAAVIAGSCGVYDVWQAVGGTSTLDVVQTVSVENEFCYQFKAVASNVPLNVSQEYISSNRVIVDRTLPVIAIINESLTFDNLSLDLNIIDTGVGVVSLKYVLNDSTGLEVGPFAEESSIDTTFTATVVDGLNRVSISATDSAGNIATYNHFVSADLTPPDINIVGIEDGGVYSGDISLVYTLTQELTDVTVYVDGVVRSDLSGLSDGSHVLLITGADIDGNTVGKMVDFTIDSNIFSFRLLSPQKGRVFSTGSVPIQYDSSKPLTSLKYVLNGGVEQTYTGQELLLADGTHNLIITALSQNGETSVANIDFSVSISVPVLNVISPVADAVYQNNVVTLNYVSDSLIDIQLDDVTISSPGNTLTVNGDGQHLLRITATHPVSKTVVTEVIKFTTDSVVPDVKILNPEPRIYTEVDIPVEYDSSKPLINVVYEIDGTPVDKISGLSAGNHVFRMTATDLAGRIIDKTVSFEVAQLEVINPKNGTRVISNVIPPVANFQYAASGNIGNYSISLDKSSPQLLSASQGPGAIVPVPVLPGEHEIALRGSINSQQIGVRTAFEIGAKNITVEPGSIDYTYSNCDTGFKNCDVLARLVIKNKGDFDVTENIKVRFDHIDNSGYETFWFDVPALESNKRTEITVAQFKASLGDLLTVTIDPYSELVSEWANDNSYSIDFSAGQIVSVSTALQESTKFIEGVSLFNLMRVTTAGPVDKVEYRFGGWLFDKNSSNGVFDANMDMGLLSTADSCIEIVAKSSADIVLDSTSQCFNIVELNMRGLTKYAYTWELHETSSRYVNFNNIDPKVLLSQVSLLRKLALSNDAVILPELKSKKEIRYKIYHDPGALANRADRVNSQWSNEGFLGGKLGLPNGRSIIVTTISPDRNTCSVNGAVMIPDLVKTRNLESLYQDEIDKINDSLLLSNIGDSSTSELIMFLTSNTFFFESETVVSVEDLLKKVGGGFLSEIISDGRDVNVLGTLIGFFDLKLNVVGWVNGDIPERISRIGFLDIGPRYVNRFVGKGCAIIDEKNLKISININGYFESGVENLTFQSLSRGASARIDAFAFLSWGLPDIIPGIDLPGSISPPPIPLAFTSTSFNLNPVDLKIPLDFGVKQGIIINNNSFEQFGPFHARFSLSLKHKQEVGSAEIRAYQLINLSFLGFGVGVEYKAIFDVDATGKFDFIAASSYPDRLFKYVNYTGSLLLYKKKKTCYFLFCSSGSWNLDKTLWSAPEPGANVPHGVNYTQGQVNSSVRAAGANWPVK